MNENVEEQNKSSLQGPPQDGLSVVAGRIIYTILKVMMPLAIVIAGGIVAVHLLKTGPQAKQMPRPKSAVLVQTVPVEFGTYPTSVEAMGVVRAAQSIELKPQVSGEVISIGKSLVPGGTFAKGEILLRLDPRDYELAVRQQASAVEQAKNNLEIEEGNQIVARRELDLLGEQVTEVEKKLMLRQPQLNSLKTALEVAEAKYEQARINLERTEVKAPFNGIVQDRNVNIGTWVSTSSILGTLIGSDDYWVEVSVPEDQLTWITFPDAPGKAGSSVKIFNPSAWEQDSYRTGKVIQLLPSLESQGRMARLLIEIEDPLALMQENRERPKVLLGAFVRVTIEGRPVSGAVKLSREYLRDGENVWILSEDGRLSIRRVSVAFRGRENMLVTDGVKQGEKMIVSSLAAPVEGMMLQLSRGNPDGSGPGERPGEMSDNGQKRENRGKGAEK